MRHLARAALLLLLVIPAFAVGQDAKYSLKAEKTPPPKELKDAVAKLLKEDALKVYEPSGQLLAEFWFRKEIPGDFTPEQVKNGLTYRELKETAIVGAVRFSQPWSDYRKNKIKAGVYALRLGFQPQDGDHAGTAPHQEFLLLTSASKDANPGEIEQRALIEMSMKSIEAAHPGVMMLFPINKAPATPRVETRPGNHVVLTTAEGAKTGGLKGSLGFGVTVIGHSDQ